MNVQRVQFEENNQARYVLAHCRSRDREEVDAVLGLEAALANLDGWLHAARVLEIFWARGRPAAFVAVHQVTAKCVAMSMIATDDWPRVALKVAKWAKRVCMPLLLSEGYARAECRAIDGHDDAIRFLDWLGFRVECRCSEYGAKGQTFIQLSWTRSANAHVLCS